MPYKYLIPLLLCVSCASIPKPQTKFEKDHVDCWSISKVAPMRRDSWGHPDHMESDRIYNQCMTQRGWK